MLRNLIYNTFAEHACYTAYIYSDVLIQLVLELVDYRRCGALCGWLYCATEISLYDPAVSPLARSLGQLALQVLSHRHTYY